MLTGNYLQRFLFRWKYAIVIILIIAAMLTAFSFQINRWIPEYALSFSNLIAQEFQTKITFRTVRYRFPNHLIFKNVKVLEANGKNTMLQASRVTLGFYFSWFSSMPIFNETLINDMVIDLPIFKNYLTLHGKKTCAWAKTFPRGKMRLLIPNGQFYPKGCCKAKSIPFEIDLSLDQNHLNTHGSWGDQDRFNYELYGDIHDSGFDVSKLTLEDGRSYMNLWGSWHNNDIYWKGFIFYNKFYILDIDGHLKIQKNDISLKQMSFSIDGNAVTARGDCLKLNLSECDADIALNNSKLHLHAQNSPQGPLLKGSLDLQGAHIDFKNLKALIINGNSLKLKIKQTQSTFSIHGNEHMISLESLLVSINFSNPDQKDIALSAKMRTGDVDGHVILNTSSLPWQIKGQGKFKDIDMYFLSSNFSSFKQCHGLLSGNFKLQTSKNIELTGNLTLHHGDFKGSDFQAWMAKTLQMPTLNHISSADLSGHFKINGSSKMLDNLRLETDNLDLNGFFHLDADDLVSSKLSIRFSKKLLGESPTGRDIIGLVHGAWTLPFEFSLSGNLYRMNFQWNNSPLKNKVRQHMFSFIQKMIDQHMDDYTTPTSGETSYKVTAPNESVSPG